MNERRTFRPPASSTGIPDDLTDYIGSEIDGAVDYLDARLQPLEEWYNDHVSAKNNTWRNVARIGQAVLVIVALLKAFNIIK